MLIYLDKDGSGVRMLWIWCHASLWSEVLDVLHKIFDLELPENSRAVQELAPPKSLKDVAIDKVFAGLLQVFEFCWTTKFPKN